MKYYKFILIVIFTTCGILSAETQTWTTTGDICEVVTVDGPYGPVSVISYGDTDHSWTYTGTVVQDEDKVVCSTYHDNCPYSEYTGTLNFTWTTSNNEGKSMGANWGVGINWPLVQSIIGITGYTATNTDFYSFGTAASSSGNLNFTCPAGGRYEFGFEVNHYQIDYSGTDTTICHGSLREVNSSPALTVTFKKRTPVGPNCAELGQVYCCDHGTGPHGQ